MDVTLLFHISWLVKIFLLSGGIKIPQSESVHTISTQYKELEVITSQTTLLRSGLQNNNETCGGLSRGSSKTHHNINCKLIFCDWYTREKVRNTGNEYGYGIRKKITDLSTGTGTDTDYFQKMKYGKSTGTDSF